GADREGVGVGSVERTVGYWRAGVAGAGRTRDRVVVLIENHELIAERERDRIRPREAVVFKTEPIGERRRIAATLHVGSVAVEVRLLEAADVEIALQRPVLSQH